MNGETEKEYLTRVLGPAFYCKLQRYREQQTSSIHQWLRDAVLDNLLGPHEHGCDCPLHELTHIEPRALATALTKAVCEGVDEAAASGVDVTELMRRHSPEEFGHSALRHPSFERYLDLPSSGGMSVSAGTVGHTRHEST